MSDACEAVEPAESPAVILCTIRETPAPKTTCVTVPLTAREEGQ